MRVERYLTREMQFCTRCRAEGKGWVQVISLAQMSELRQGRNERAARAAYFARRKRALCKHYAQMHPGVALA